MNVNEQTKQPSLPQKFNAIAELGDVDMMLTLQADVVSAIDLYKAKLTAYKEYKGSDTNWQRQTIESLAYLQQLQQKIKVWIEDRRPAPSAIPLNIAKAIPKPTDAANLAALVIGHERTMLKYRKTKSQQSFAKLIAQQDSMYKFAKRVLLRNGINSTAISDAAIDALEAQEQIEE